MTAEECERIDQWRQDTQKRDEAYRRTVKVTRDRLSSILYDLQRINIGSAIDGINALRDDLSDEFGTPALLEEKLKEVTK